MSFQDLLQYGNWSGPGWTACKKDDAFESAGVDRILSAADRLIAGIDVYDNFVAKAHDMNEYAAQGVLREVLKGLGLIDNTTTVVDDSPAYETRLKLSEGGDERSRFASFNTYRDALTAAGGTAEQHTKLGYAFSLYYRHAALSNQQFALDFAFNRPSLLKMILDFSSLEFTLVFGPHLFLREAADLLDQAAGAERKVEAVPPGLSEWRAYLRDHFVAPTGPDFGGEGLVYTPTLTLDGLAGLTHSDVTRLFQALTAAAEGNARAGRIYHRYRPQGAASVQDALQVLSYP